MSHSMFPWASLSGIEWGRRNRKNYILVGVGTVRTVSLCAENTRPCV